MEEYLHILKKAKLFKDFGDGDILSILNCLKAKVKSYPKNAVILPEGTDAEYIGIVLSGEAEIQKTGFDGSSNIVSSVFPGGIIAAAAVYSASKRLPFDVVSAEESEILCLDGNSLIRPCRMVCGIHTKVIENMLGALADKNIQLSEKIDILTKRTIREKITAYLYSQSKRTNGASFSVSLTRRQMADYLSVDRSALSRELGKMRDEGILEFEGNRFRFLL